MGLDRRFWLWLFRLIAVVYGSVLVVIGVAFLWMWTQGG